MNSSPTKSQWLIVLLKRPNQPELGSYRSVSFAVEGEEAMNQIKNLNDSLEEGFVIDSIMMQPGIIRFRF